MKPKLTQSEYDELTTSPANDHPAKLPLYSHVAKRLAARGLLIAEKQSYINTPCYRQSRKAEAYVQRYAYQKDMAR